MVSSTCPSPTSRACTAVCPAAMSWRTSSMGRFSSTKKCQLPLLLPPVVGVLGAAEGGGSLGADIDLLGGHQMRCVSQGRAHLRVGDAVLGHHGLDGVTGGEMADDHAD